MILNRNFCMGKLKEREVTTFPENNQKFKWAASWQNHQNGMCLRLRSAWASAQSDQSSRCAHWVVKDPSYLRVDSKDFDQTGRMPRLI